MRANGVRSLDVSRWQCHHPPDEATTQLKLANPSRQASGCNIVGVSRMWRFYTKRNL
jgi:hypothetical protein